jgi:hypothetical protein
LASRGSPASPPPRPSPKTPKKSRPGSDI